MVPGPSQRDCLLSMKEVSATPGRRRLVVTWDITLGAEGTEDLIDLDATVEGWQRAEV